MLKELIKVNASFKACFKLRLAGVVSEDVLQSIYDSGLKEHTELMGYVSHEEAVKLQQQSQVLLLVEIDSHETKGILPGKLYEYMAARRPILAIGPQHWDAAEIIEDTLSGASLGYGSKNGLKDVILKWFEAFQNGSLTTESKDIEKYSRRELSRELANLI